MKPQFDAAKLCKLATEFPAYYLAWSVAHALFGVEPDRGDVISCGRWLRSLGALRMRNGPTGMWLLDADLVRRITSA